MSNKQHWRLKTICPACGGGEPKNWYHDKSSCCRDDGWIRINEECEIFCDECDKRFCSKGTPSFILYWRFKCGNHQTPDGYKEAEKEHLLAAVGAICLTTTIPKSIAFKMIKIIEDIED